TLQTGTTTDDRGVTGVPTADGGALVVATTYGAMGEPQGGVDVVVLPVPPDGTPGEATQLGSRERDGADEWDEANLFAAEGAEGVWLSGLTFGAPDGAVNAGAADVFVMQLASVPGEEPTTEPEPTAEPTDPPATAEPTDGAPSPTDGVTGPPGLPTPGDPTGAAPPAGPAPGAGAGGAGLPTTGAAVAGAVLAALVLGATGALVVARRRAVV